MAKKGKAKRTGRMEVEDFNIYPEETELIKNIAIKKGIPTMCVGEAGLGKSTTSVKAMEELDYPYETVNLSKQHDLVDLVGQFVMEKELDKNDNPVPYFVFKDGKVTHAAQEGKCLILEELTMAEPTVLSAFHGLAETPAKLHTTQGDIEVHDDFRLITTANPSWTNYEGVCDLNYAFEDRFAHILFGFPTQDKIEMFLARYESVLNDKDILIEDLYECRAKLFSLYPRQITNYLSLRGMKFFYELLEDYEVVPAMKMSFLNKCEPDERKEIADIIDNYIPQY